MPVNPYARRSPLCFMAFNFLGSDSAPISHLRPGPRSTTLNLEPPPIVSRISSVRDTDLPNTDINFNYRVSVNLHHGSLLRASNLANARIHCGR